MATKRKHNEVTLKVKYVELKQGRLNKDKKFPVVPLLLIRKTKQKFDAFENSSLKAKVSKNEHTKI